VTNDETPRKTMHVLFVFGTAFEASKASNGATPFTFEIEGLSNRRRIIPRIEEPAKRGTS
jgi:hypothetical protein